MPKITKHGGPSIAPTGVTGTWGDEESEMNTECSNCTTKYAPSLLQCPHCGVPVPSEEQVEEVPEEQKGEAEEVGETTNIDEAAPGDPEKSGEPDTWRHESDLTG